MKDDILSQGWYLRLVELMGGETGLSFDNFRSGYTLFAINLDNSILSNKYKSQAEVGSLALHMNFERPLDSNQYLYCYGIFHDTITLEPKTKIISMTYVPQNFG